VGKLHYIVRDFGFIPERGGKIVHYKKGYVHNVPKEHAENWYFKRNEDPSHLKVVDEIVAAAGDNPVSEDVIAQKLEEATAAGKEKPSPVKHTPIGQMMADRVGIQPPPPRDKLPETRTAVKDETQARKHPARK